MYLPLLGSFGVVAVFLAAAGFYGVMSSSVAQRTREFGIRLALGSQPGTSLRLVTVQGVQLVIAGLVVGTAGAFVAAPCMYSMLYGTSPLDMRALVGAAVSSLLEGLLAAIIPAYRATRLDPVQAIHTEYLDTQGTWEASDGRTR